MEPLLKNKTLLELQSLFGDNQLKVQVVCPQIGTAVLRGLIVDEMEAVVCLTEISASQLVASPESLYLKNDSAPLKKRDTGLTPGVLSSPGCIEITTAYVCFLFFL